MMTKKEEKERHEYMITALQEEKERISKISTFYTKQDISRSADDQTRYSDTGLKVTNALYDAQKSIEQAIIELKNR